MKNKAMYGLTLILMLGLGNNLYADTGKTTFDWQGDPHFMNGGADKADFIHLDKNELAGFIGDMQLASQETLDDIPAGNKPVVTGIAEPATVYLFLTAGLAGLFAMRRRIIARLSVPAKTH